MGGGRMINSRLLKSFIVKNGLTQKQVAENIGISKQSFSAKINNKVNFKVDEAVSIALLLQLTDIETTEIFFAKK